MLSWQTDWQTDRQTDRRADDSIMPAADCAAYHYHYYYYLLQLPLIRANLYWPVADRNQSQKVGASRALQCQGASGCDGMTVCYVALHSYIYSHSHEGHSKHSAIWYEAGNISKIFALFFNIITLNSNTYVTSVRNLFDISQIELWWHAVQIRLSTQWPVWSHCHRGTTSSDDEIGRSHWVSDLVSMVGVIDNYIFQSNVLYYSLRNKNKVQRRWRDQAGLWVVSGEHATRILFDWHQRAFWQM